MKNIALGLLAAIGTTAVWAQDDVRLNQVAMYPEQEKTAVIEGTPTGHVTVTAADGSAAAVHAKVLRHAVSPWSGRERTVVDISQVRKPGLYRLQAKVDGRMAEATFQVRPHALHDVVRSALRAYYLMRSGCPIDEPYADGWQRPCGHPDTAVIVHPSAASPGRPGGTLIQCPGGWYDAGDYNKYIVNSAFTVSLMLFAYEMNRQYYDTLHTGIPESGNRTADLLDELMYNLQWMLTMQDPWDGGVYHKLTTPSFEAFIMPADCRQPRYVVQKTTCATLDFAAVMAQAARIFRGNADYPDFATKATRAALSAYHWASRHPAIYYRQDELNILYDPDISTGAYDDEMPDDEVFWAATELYLLTGDDRFLTDAHLHAPQRYATPTWGGVAGFGIFRLASTTDSLPSPKAQQLAEKARCLLLAYADSVMATTQTSCFQTPMGNRANDFGWGCLAETFGTGGVSLLLAHRLTGDGRYLEAAQQCADYLLGRNATGYCYVTGFGTRRVMHPHHRLSAADGIEPPMPGLLVGGPNPGQQDRNEQLAYPSQQPDESYVDVEASYASNEIAINWNAALVALTGWLEAERNKPRLPYHDEKTKKPKTNK